MHNTDQRRELSITIAKYKGYRVVPIFMAPDIGKGESIHEAAKVITGGMMALLSHFGYVIFIGKESECWDHIPQYASDLNAAWSLVPDTFSIYNEASYVDSPDDRQIEITFSDLDKGVKVSMPKTAEDIAYAIAFNWCIWMGIKARPFRPLEVES